MGVMLSRPKQSSSKFRVFKPANKEELLRAITKEMKRKGTACDLNFIDVSGISNFTELFLDSAFNGDISQWNVSNATTMHRMFESSKFNGDISAWDVSKVTDMGQMFGLSSFNGDVSKWNVFSVRNFKQIFYKAAFEGRIARWAIDPEAVIFTMYSLEQAQTAKEACLLHWRLAEIDINNISPVLQHHYNQHATLINSIVSDPVERSYWFQDLWCWTQAQKSTPQAIYSVGTELFDTESNP